MEVPKLLGSAPTLLVRDVVASADYYRDQVGFSYDRFWGDPPGFCILYRDRCHLMLKQLEDPTLVAPNNRAVEELWDAYFWVDDVECLHQEIVKREARVVSSLCDQPHGCREFGVGDLDGHIITFGEVLGDGESADGSRGQTSPV